MPKTRIGKRHGTIHPHNQAPLADRRGTNGRATARPDLKQPAIARPWRRESSYAEWNNMDDAAIISLTESLDRELALLEGQTAQDAASFRNDTPPGSICTEIPSAQYQSSPAGSEGQISPPPETQAPSAEESIHGGQVLTPDQSTGALRTVERPIGATVFRAVAASDALTPEQLTRVDGQEVPIMYYQKRTVRSELEEVVPAQIGHGSQDNPIVLGDNTHGHDGIPSQEASQRQQKQSFGMVQWSSPEYEDGIITSFEKKWEDIQLYWMNMDDMRHQTDDTQIVEILDSFDGCLEKVYDNGSLAQGSASFLLEEWKDLEAKVRDCCTDVLCAHPRRRMKRLGGILEEFELQERLYDVIVDFRHTSSSEE